VEALSAVGSIDGTPCLLCTNLYMNEIHPGNFTVDFFFLDLLSRNRGKLILESLHIVRN
jgi:hypothetical protein